MKRTELEIDFYKELELPKKIICGLVEKILSPKGVRKLNEYDRYEYSLKSELVQVYDEKPVTVTPGIYWVMDIYKPSLSEQHWNHYLIVVEDDCFYPVAEFIDCRDSTWVKDAIPYIKDYFEGFELEPIELTKQKREKPKKPSWKLHK